MTFAATGFATAASPSADLAVNAVREALARAGRDYANSVVLYLSPDHQRWVHPCVQAVSRFARCLQVTGCTVPGIFTERALKRDDAPEWALDQPAAAALVLCGPVSLATTQAGVAGGEPLLTLAGAGTGLDKQLSSPVARYGTLFSGVEGHPRGLAWSQCRLREDGAVEARFSGARTSVAVSRGMQPCSPCLPVTARMGFELTMLGHRHALDTLLDAIPDAEDDAASAASRCFAAVLDDGNAPELALEDGRYALVPVIGIGQRDRSVTLAARLPERSLIVWVRQDPHTAIADSRRALAEINEAAPAPDFALMFSCIGRGPYFYGGEDRDLSLLLDRYPGLPVLGAYGTGEIGPVAGENALLSYSTVYALVGAGH